jgi:hypothetical protein
MSQSLPNVLVHATFSTRQRDPLLRVAYEAVP